MSQKQLEKRHFKGLELRQEAEKKPKIVGYAAVFNRDADLGWFRETILPGAFRDSLDRGDDVRALVGHDPDKIIGRNKAGTLVLREDSKGLVAEIDPPDTQVGRDIVESVRRGDVDGMSFAFHVADQEFEIRNGQSYHILKRLDLVDVSVVTFPAYEDTDVAVRALKLWEQEHGPATTYEQNARELDVLAVA